MIKGYYMNFTIKERDTLLKALDLLINTEQDTQNHTDLILKLRGYDDYAS